MVTLVKHEWHRAEIKYSLNFDEDLLCEIYPELDKQDIASKIKLIESGEISIEVVVRDAADNDVDLDWEHQSDDIYTIYTGDYEVTFEVG